MHKGSESSSSSSSSSSYICHAVGPLVDPFRSHVSRSLFKGLPWFLLPFGQLCFITLGNLFRGIVFTCCTVTVCCHNTDLVHVNGHDRTILVIFSQALQGSLMMDPPRSETCWGTFKYFIILIVSTYYILCFSWEIKGKVKWSHYRPSLAQRVGGGIALLFHDRGTRKGWVVSVTSRPLFTPRKEPVPIVQEAGWAPGPVWTGGKSRPHRDSIPDRPARSQSLYRLSCPAHISWVIKCLMIWMLSLYTFENVLYIYINFRGKRSTFFWSWILCGLWFCVFVGYGRQWERDSIRIFWNVGGNAIRISQWRTERGVWGAEPPPRNSEGPPKSCQTQPHCENC